MILNWLVFIPSVYFLNLRLMWVCLAVEFISIGCLTIRPLKKTYRTSNQLVLDDLRDRIGYTLIMQRISSNFGSDSAFSADIKLIQPAVAKCFKILVDFGFF